MFARRCSVLLTAAFIALLSEHSVRAEDYGGGFPEAAAVGTGAAYVMEDWAERRYYDAPRYRRPDYYSRSHTYIAPPRYRERRVRTRSYSLAREGRRTVQRQLNQLGFNAGPADGVYGKLTRAAMAAFQADLGERATGRLTGKQVAILSQKSGSGWRSDAGPSPSSVNLAGRNRAEPEVETAAIAPVGPVFSAEGLPIDPNRTEERETQDQATGSHAEIVVAQQTAIVPEKTIDDSFVITLPPGALPKPLPRALPSTGPFNNEKWRPKVFGITVGDNRTAVRTSLGENGYNNCTEGGATMVCTSANQSLSDRIYIAFSTEKNEKPAFLIRRILSFKKPVGRAFLERQMAGRYPRLLADSDGILSSSETCTEFVALKPGRSDNDALQTLFDRQENKAAVDEATLDLLEACPDFYAVAFDGKDKVSHVEIVIFDAASLRTRHLAELRQRRAERFNSEAVGETLKF